MNFQRPKRWERRPALSDRMKLSALQIAIRRPDVLLSVKDLLQPEHFDELATPERCVIWAIVRDFYAKHQRMPSEPVILAEFFERAKHDPRRLHAQARQRGVKLLAQAFAVDPSQLDGPWAIDKIQMILLEDANKLAAMSLSGDGAVLTELGKFAESLFLRTQLIESVSGGVDDVLFPVLSSGLVSTPLEKISTGVDFIDDFLNGGAARGEVNTLSGPYGSCKTMLAMQLCVEASRRSLDEWEANGCKGRLGTAIYVFYESTIEQVRNRLLSYACGISKHFLDSLTDVRELSTSKNLKEYELRRYRALIENGIQPLGELERIQRETELLNKNLVAWDMTGKKASRGTGGLQEIVALCHRFEQENPDRKIDLLYIDYAGSMVERQINAGRAKRDHVRFLIGHLPLHVSNDISNRFNCISWVNHQLSAAANGMAPGTLPKGTDTADAKNFSENADFSLVIGKPTLDKLCQMGVTKSRRAAERPPVVIRINGDYGRVESTNGQYVSDPASHQIVTAAEARQVVEEPGRVSIISPLRGGGPLDALAGGVFAPSDD